MASGCALHGGCPSDYAAVAFAAVSLVLLLARATFPFLVQKGCTTTNSSFWLITVQIIGSFNLILSLVMSVDYLKTNRRHPWQSCYAWAVWFEGPLGFGLLMSCRIVQAFQLYHLFVKRRLPPVRSCVLLPVILIPWVAGALFIHIRKPLNYRCHMRNQWVVPVVCLHGFYIVALIGFTRAIRHVEFIFHELEDLLRGIIVSSIAMGLWIIAFVFNEIHEDVPWVEVASRFVLLVTASILVQAFFSISVSQPFLSQMSIRQRESLKFSTMGQALGITDSGLVNTTDTTQIDANEPLDKLLRDKRFRQSFMGFADSCLAGESVHFYDEVLELEKIPVNDTVKRIYMARHIIEKYNVAGAAMEVNISHRTRQEILGTLDLSQPSLFDHAVAEVIQLMKTNLSKDYWSSTFFMKFREESRKQLSGNDLADGWDICPRPSCVHGADDPFYQEYMYKGAL